MTSENQLDSNLVSYLQGAARLRLETQLYENDQNEISQGKKVIYAIDTNILHLYLTPQKTGPRPTDGSRGEGYGVVFNNDTPETATLIGAILSRKILSPSNKKRAPLLVLPGHDSEVRSLGNDIVKESLVDLRAFPKKVKKVEDLFQRLADVQDNKSLIETLQKETTNLIQVLFYDNDPSLKLRRWDELKGETLYTSLDSVMANDPSFFFKNIKDAKIKEALLLPKHLKELLEEGNYCHFWGNILKKFKASKRSVQADILALGRLELINRSFKANDIDASLVLITGDDSLHKAASYYFPYEGDGEKSSFASLYLRHPRAFLATPQLFMPLAETGLHMARAINIWLDSILEKFANNERVTDNYLHCLADAAPDFIAKLNKNLQSSMRSEEQEVEKIRAVWINCISQLKASHTTVSNIAQKEFSQLVSEDFITTQKHFFEKVRTILQEKNKEAWRHLLEVLLRSSYDLISNDLNLFQHRNIVPPIRFSSFPKAEAFVQNVSSFKKKFQLSYKDFQVMIYSLRGEDPSGYSLCLAFSFLYSWTGRWHLAQQLAMWAVDIFQEVKETNDLITGREAYYFSAVMQRLGAISVEDLKTIKPLLNRAQRAHSKDKARENKTLVSDLRIRLEKSNLELTYHLFKHFIEANIRVDRSLQDLYEKFRINYNDYSLEQDNWVKISVVSKILCNMFMIGALLEAKGELNEIIEGNLSELVGPLSANLRELDSDHYCSPKSRVVEIFECYAFIRFGRNSKRDCEEKVKILKQLNADETEQSRKQKGALYELKRLELIVDLTNEFIKAQA